MRTPHAQRALHVFVPFLHLALALGAAGCDDGLDDPEPDAATTYDTRTVSADVAYSASYAVLEVDGVAWGAVGTSLVRIPTPGAAETILDATRIHGALAHHDGFVYFATQSLRSGIQGLGKTTPVGGRLDDGALYRARSDGTGTPEKIFDVGILVGDFTVSDGHLFVCESPGLNAEGALVDLTLSEKPTATRHTFRFNEYCEGVVADDEHLFLAMNTAHKSTNGSEGITTYPSTLEIARARRDAETPWAPSEGPTRIATTLLSPGLRGMHLVDGDVWLTTPEVVARYDRDGAEKPAPEPPAGVSPRLYSVFPLEGGLVTSIRGGQTNVKDDTCHGGDIAFTGPDGARRRLTQAVCDAQDVSASPDGSALWLLESAYLIQPDYDGAYRVRVKRVPLR